MEMLLIEKGGPQQVQEELDAYNPLLPKGNELIATVMFEIDNPLIRKRKLGLLGMLSTSGCDATSDDARTGDVDKFMFVDYGKQHLAVPATDLPRTEAGEKASAVQFMKWKFSAEQVQPNQHLATPRLCTPRSPSFCAPQTFVSVSAIPTTTTRAVSLQSSYRR